MAKVFCIGVFDMFHFGHLRLLQRSAELGELTVGVVSDAPIKGQKGETRPVIGQDERIAIVGALKVVNRTILMEDFALTQEIVDDHDVIIIGQDQKHINNQHLIPVEKLHLLTRTAGVSTSDIVKRIKGEA